MSEILASCGLHHLALGARDLNKLALFYERALGLSRHSEHLDESGKLRSIWLNLTPQRPGASVLMLEKTALLRPDAEPSLAVQPGWFLSAFSVHVAERASMEQQIIAAGSAIEQRTLYSSYARDPEGNRFAISCYPLATPAPQE